MGSVVDVVVVVGKSVLVVGKSVLLVLTVLVVLVEVVLVVVVVVSHDRVCSSSRSQSPSILQQAK
jgi:hypothetical protein